MARHSAAQKRPPVKDLPSAPAGVYEDISQLLGVVVEHERRRGRGAHSNASGRYEPITRVGFDDGWRSLDDLPPFRGGGNGRNVLSCEHARDALGFILGREVSHQLSGEAAVDAAPGELADDAQPAASLHTPGRADVGGGDAALKASVEATKKRKVS